MTSEEFAVQNALTTLRRLTAEQLLYVSGYIDGLKEGKNEECNETDPGEDD